MPPPLLKQPSLFGKLVALIIAALGGCYLFDTVASFMGWNTAAFCTYVDLLLSVAVPAGMVLVGGGFIVWFLTRYRNWLAFEIGVVGLLVSAAPSIVPPISSLPCGY